MRNIQKILDLEFLDNYVHIVYRIMQIVCGGKPLRLHALFVIRGKSFAIVWAVQETPYYIKREFAGKLSRLHTNPRKP